MKIDKVINNDIRHSEDQLRLNTIQRNALCAALNQQIALVQVPPGTGKSFLARQILSTLSANRNLVPHEVNDKMLERKMKIYEMMGSYELLVR